MTATWARTRLRSLVHTAGIHIRTAPGNYVWLLLLAITTIVQRVVSEPTLMHILHKRSTNLYHLANKPLSVLWESAFWLDGPFFLLYLALFAITSIPVERWLGTARWFAIVALCHIGATLISEGVLWWAIHDGHASPRNTHDIDVGVSYALAGAAGVLTYRLPRPWRYFWIAALLLGGAGMVAAHLTFTNIGHLTAVLLGLACYPLTLGVKSTRTSVVGTLDTDEPQPR